MDKVLRKYAFANEAAAKSAIDALGTDEEGNPTHNHGIYILGNIVTTPGTYDDEGEELTAPVLSDTYNVDVLWNGTPSSDWDSQMVWMAPFGALVAGASEVQQEWIAQCKIERPELFPEPTDEELV